MEKPTELYLVRIWHHKSGDGAPALHGKLQHVLSGQSSFFDGLSALPAALQKMMEQELTSLGPRAGDTPGDWADSF